MPHKFNVGQTVRFQLPVGHLRTTAGGLYEVIERLDRNGELEYRVKSLNEPHERIVKESDLIAAE